jgi:hypothetical protein
MSFSTTFSCPSDGDLFSKFYMSSICVWKIFDLNGLLPKQKFLSAGGGLKRFFANKSWRIPLERDWSKP